MLKKYLQKERKKKKKERRDKAKRKRETRKIVHQEPGQR